MMGFENRCEDKSKEALSLHYKRVQNYYIYINLENLPCASFCRRVDTTWVCHYSLGV